MKKLLAAILAVVLVLSMAACGGTDSNSGTKKKTVKVGFIFLHDENSTYDLNFLNAAKAACEKLGVEYILKTNINEGSECLVAAEDLIDEGCTIIFGDSFGHEPYLIDAAKKYPNVEFCHATGTMAHTEALANFHDSFASIYEGRYTVGVAAGLKINEMIAEGKITADQAKVGYVGAFTYAEVISGLTSFFLGVQSVCPTATMEVQFTGSWYDYKEEKEAAQTLINNGCVLISGHADSLGAPEACEAAGVPNISYNGSTIAAGPNTYIVSSKINWQPYFEYIITCQQKGEIIATDYTGTLSDGAVQVLEINEKVAAAGTAEKLEQVKKDLIDGKIKVFDTDTFTVNGEKLTSYMADVDTDADYTPDTEVVKDGEFHESTFRSAPYFDIKIDGIEFLNVAY